MTIKEYINFSRKKVLKRIKEIKSDKGKAKAVVDYINRRLEDHKNNFISPESISSTEYYEKLPQKDKQKFKAPNGSIQKNLQINKLVSEVISELDPNANSNVEIATGGYIDPESLNAVTTKYIHSNKIAPSASSSNIVRYSKGNIDSFTAGHERQHIRNGDANPAWEDNFDPSKSHNPGEHKGNYLEGKANAEGLINTKSFNPKVFPNPKITDLSWMAKEERSYNKDKPESDKKYEYKVTKHLYNKRNKKNT